MARLKSLVFIFVLSIVFSLGSCRRASSHTRGGEDSRRVDEQVEEDAPSKGRSTENQTTKGSLNPLSGSQIFKRYNKSVFMIFTSDGSNNYQGSGFFIGKNGLAVSNYHVFKGTSIGAEYIKLSFDNQNLYKVSEVICRSQEPDFIIFRVAYNNDSYIPLSKTKPNVGDKVFAIGSPRGLENTFSSGEVSQWRGEYLMQINAQIDHGSSGGALINEYGEAVGITSGSFCDGSQANLNYAWSIDAVKGHY